MLYFNHSRSVVARPKDRCGIRRGCLLLSIKFLPAEVETLVPEYACAAALTKTDGQSVILHVVHPIVMKLEVMTDRLQVVTVNELTVMNLCVVVASRRPCEEQAARPGT